MSELCAVRRPLSSWCQSRRRPVRGPHAAWLQAGGSLSARLALAQSPLAVQVLAQGRVPLNAVAAAGLGLRPRQAVHGRTVLMSGGGRAMVLAHSVVGQPQSRGVWRAIRGLGRRPLAQLLFTRVDVRRTPLQWRWLPPRHPQARWVAQQWDQAVGAAGYPGRGVWQRWSCFFRQGQPLWVSEFFVPAELARWPATRAAHYATVQDVGR